MAAEWDDLISKLNSVPLSPTLSKQTWQKRLQDWRYALNHKHRKLVLEANMTGGGPSSLKDLKDFEKRAVQVFNPITNTGNPELTREAGIDESFEIPAEYIIEETITDCNLGETAPNGIFETPSNVAMSLSNPPSHTVASSSQISNEVRQTSSARVGVRRTASEQETRNEANCARGQSHKKRRLTNVLSTAATTDANEKFQLMLAKMEEIENRRIAIEQAEREQTRQTIAASVSTFSSAIEKLAEAITLNMLNKG